MSPGCPSGATDCRPPHRHDARVPAGTAAEGGPKAVGRPSPVPGSRSARNGRGRLVRGPLHAGPRRSRAPHASPRADRPGRRRTERSPRGRRPDELHPDAYHRSRGHLTQSRPTQGRLTRGRRTQTHRLGQDLPIQSRLTQDPPRQGHPTTVRRGVAVGVPRSRLPRGLPLGCPRSLRPRCSRTVRGVRDGTPERIRDC